MKCQYLFSLRNKIKEKKWLSAEFVMGTLWVNLCRFMEYSIVFRGTICWLIEFTSRHKVESFNFPAVNNIILYLNILQHQIFSQASVAQLNTRPNGDEEIAGLTPARSAKLFYGDWSWNIFYDYSVPSADSRRAVVSFWKKNVHNTG